MWGILFALTNVAFRAFFVGITRTRLLGYSAAIMAVVNVGLDYLLIFGNFGFPEMGIGGAALASVIAEAVSALFFIIATLTNRENRKYCIFKLPKFNWEIITKTWNISVFIMLQNFVSIAAWFLFFIVIEQTGEHPLAISNIVRSIYMLLMIHIWSFSSSVNTLVSNAIGEGNTSHVMHIINKVNKLSIVITVLVLAIALCIPDLLIRIYTENESLIRDARPVLFVVIGALIPLSLAINWFSGVSGTANTKMALLIETATIVFYLSFVFIVAIVMKASLPVIWTSEFVYTIVLGLFSYLYLKFGKWRGKEI
nr:MATE family efflux transporter [Bacteroidota bacterium]